MCFPAVCFCCCQTLSPLCISHDDTHIAHCPWMEFRNWTPTVHELTPDLARCTSLSTRSAGSSLTIEEGPCPQLKGQRWCQRPHASAGRPEQGLEDEGIQWAPSHQANSGSLEAADMSHHQVCPWLGIRLPNPFLVAALFLRPTQACSVWSSIHIRTCPSTRKRSWKCTRARRGMRCHRTSTPSRTPPTGA